MELNRNVAINYRGPNISFNPCLQFVNIFDIEIMSRSLLIALFTLIIKEIC